MTSSEIKKTIVLGYTDAPLLTNGNDATHAGADDTDSDGGPLDVSAASNGAQLALPGPPNVTTPPIHR